MPSRGRADQPGIAFAVPALALYAAFALLPLVAVLGLSFTRWNGFGALEPVGLANWTSVLADPRTWSSVLITALAVVLAWVMQVPLAALLGVYLSARRWWTEVLSAVMFAPLLLSSAAIAIIWKAISDPNFGLAAGMAKVPLLGALAQNWLGDPQRAVFVVVFVMAWQFMPFHTLLFVAATRQIPESIYEAATLDGAGRLSRFLAITLPQLRYTIVTSSTLVIVNSVTAFDMFYLLTNGGPGESTLVLPLYMYKLGFLSQQFGPASVVAVLLAVVGLALALVIVRVSGFGRMESQQEGA